MWPLFRQYPIGSFGLGQSGNGPERPHGKASSGPLPRPKDYHVANGWGSPDLIAGPGTDRPGSRLAAPGIHMTARGERPDPIRVFDVNNGNENVISAEVMVPRTGHMPGQLRGLASGHRFRGRRHRPRTIARVMEDEPTPTSECGINSRPCNSCACAPHGPVSQTAGVSHTPCSGAPAVCHYLHPQGRRNPLS